jgi:hypothetical protein
MSGDLKDILSNSNKDIDNQQLMDYLSNELSKAGSHEVEKSMAEDEFMNDAVEGLQQIGGKKNMQEYVEQLNRGLQKQIAKNKKLKNKRRWKDSPYTYIAIVLILALMVLCYVFLRARLHAADPAKKTITEMKGDYIEPGRSSSNML